jgi:hypothetical protein
VRIQFVPGREPPELLVLPWTTPLAQWDTPALVRMAHGNSRHVVRFVQEGERVYALKEMASGDAQHEYAMLRSLAAERLPAVEAVGLVTDRSTDPDAVLITRYLDFALPFVYLVAREAGPQLGTRLVDAAVVLLVRLHVAGRYWGDCSLNNLLFRRDAGQLMAYLVDAETMSVHRPPLGDSLRTTELELAKENVVGGLLDLQASGRVSEDFDPVDYAERLEARYDELWDELTATTEVDAADRHVVEQRVRRLNDLGFDVGEVILDAAGQRLRMTPALVEEGYHARQLLHLTGLDVQENQARRILNDIASFGAWLERESGTALPAAIVAARWIAEVFEPLVAAVPEALRARIEPAELIHELLEHRYYLSEAAGREVDNGTAIASYVENVLSSRPEERIVVSDD